MIKQELGHDLKYKANNKHLTIEDIKEKHQRQKFKAIEEWKESVELL